MQIEELSIDQEAHFLRFIEAYQGEEPFWLANLKSGAAWTNPVFLNAVKTASTQKYDWRPPAGKTSQTRYLMRDLTGQFVATSLLGFPLDDQSELGGGNILVSVPPMFRKRGFGSYCMAPTLFEAVRAGLRGVFVTCPDDDLAAKRMITLNRGVLHDSVVDPGTEKHVARYWIRFDQ